MNWQTTAMVFSLLLLLAWAQCAPAMRRALPGANG